MRPFTSLTTFPFSILLLILALSLAMRLYHLDYSSPLYPPLAMPFGSFGVVALRILGVLSGASAVLLMYLFSKYLRLSKDEKSNEWIGLASAALMALMAAPVFLSRQVPYDMLSFTLLMAGLALLHRLTYLKKPKLWQRENEYFFAAIAFFLSFLIQPVTLIFFPVILLWEYVKSKKTDRGSFLYLKYCFAPLVVAITGSVIWHSSDLVLFQNLINTFIDRRLDIIQEFTEYTLLPFMYAIGGVIFLIARDREKRPSAFWLIASAGIAPMVPRAAGTVHPGLQHTFLSAVFLLPIAGYFFTTIPKQLARFGTALVAIAFISIFLYSQHQVRELERSWPPVAYYNVTATT